MGVSLTKGSVGANATAPITSTSAILATGMAVVDKLVLGNVYTITSLKQAEDVLGITAAYDTANSVVLHQHIADFYSFPQNLNAKLFIMVVTPVAADPSVLLEDLTNVAARKLLVAGEGEIKQLAFAYNLAVGTVETQTDGINTEIRAAIAKAQALYDWAYSTDRPCNMLLEGRAASDNLATLIDLRNIPSGAAILEAHKVSVVIGQDWDYAEARLLLCKKYAGVGKALGTVAAAEVNQSIAEVEIFDLSDATKGTWVTGGISNHKNIVETDAFTADMDEKGYIFPGTYTGVSGLRWNNDPVCTPIVIDEDGNINEHTIYFGRTMDMAALRLKAHLTNKLKKRVFVNTATGKLATAVIKAMESDANTKVFGKMVNEQLISGGKTIIDKNSDLLTPPKTLNATFEVVPTAILENIVGEIRLKRTI